MENGGKRTEQTQRRNGKVRRPSFSYIDVTVNRKQATKKCETSSLSFDCAGFFLITLASSCFHLVPSATGNAPYRPRHSLPLLLYNLYVTRSQNPTLLILGEDAGLRRGDARRLSALLGVDHAGLRLLYRMHTRAFDASLVSAGVALNVGTD